MRARWTVPLFVLLSGASALRRRSSRPSMPSGASRSRAASTAAWSWRSAAARR